MLRFDDQVGALDERSTERMNFRTKPHIKQTIQRAAALTGVDDSVFTMNAAYRIARETIETHQRTSLASLDHETFFAAMNAPPEPTETLRAAQTRHRETVASR